MPTYQYACEACGEDFEVVQSFSDPSLTSHDAGCGGAVHKRYGAVGVVFKGTGFYRNDSRGKDKSESATSSDSGSTKTESTPAKTDSTPAPVKKESAPAAKPAATSSSSSSSAA